MNATHSLSYNTDIITGKRAVASIGVAFFVFATVLGAFVRIPVAGSPVPITLQTFFVLLAGAVLGRRLGAASQAVYLVLGAAGLPIFQGSAFGMSYLSGPTGGYLVGFAAAAYVVGLLTAGARPSMARCIVSFAAGSLVIYACGATWLAYLYRMSFTSAVSAGVLPFVPGDIVKVLVAAMIYSRIAGRSRQLFSA